MTKRNNQYERFVNQDMVDRELTRLAGQITNLRKGNVETVELISGENLLPPVDPVQRYLETKKLNELNIPISQAIEEIRGEVTGLRPSIRQAIEDVNRDPPQNDENDQPRGLRPRAIEPPQNDPPQKDPFKVGFAFLTKENKKILEEQGLHPDIIFNQNEFNEWYKKDIERTKELNKEVYGVEKRRNTTTEKRKKELNKLIGLNTEYREALKDLKKYMMPEKKGHGFNTSAYGAKARTSTPRSTKSTASGRSPRRTKYAACGAFAPRSTLSTACPVLDQMIERARVLIGEINAGNTSVNLRNELSRILLTLYKNKIISKEEYRRFATM